MHAANGIGVTKHKKYLSFRGAMATIGFVCAYKLRREVRLTTSRRSKSKI